MHIPGQNQAYTTDASQYMTLLEQAAEVLDGNTYQTEKDRAWLQEADTHERAHGQAAVGLGNSDTVSYYGVEFVVDQDGLPSFWPYHFIAGPLKKIHQAWVAVAPADRSLTDIAIAKDLGYSEDYIELQQRALAEPPVEEGWQRVVAKSDVVEALQRLLMATDFENTQT